MKKQNTFIVWGIFILGSILVTACAGTTVSNTPTVEKAATLVTYSDPFTYCDAVGTIDQPDGRYAGDRTPDSIIKGYIKAADLKNSTEPSDVFKQATLWRCMDKKVYACNFGANLPCDSKANIDKTPTQGMVDFCKENQNSDFIPMSVTGHTTIYSWHCAKDAPEVLDQLDKADPAGFLERIWYQIQPGS